MPDPGMPSKPFARCDSQRQAPQRRDSPRKTSPPGHQFVNKLTYERLTLRRRTLANDKRRCPAALKLRRPPWS